MTAQIDEIMLYVGHEGCIEERPLEPYLEATGQSSLFRNDWPALRRGYYGTWEIVQQRLYLVNLHGSLREVPGSVSLATLFLDYPNRVFAHWYSGELRFRLNFHLDLLERDVWARIERGVVVQSEGLRPQVDDEDLVAPMVRIDRNGNRTFYLSMFDEEPGMCLSENTYQWLKQRARERIEQALQHWPRPEAGA